MDKETKDTLLKVAHYATEGEKQTQSKVVYTALVVSIALFVCTILFSDERTGLLYGIVPEEICDLIRILIYGSSLCLLIFWLRVRWFWEAPSKEPQRSVTATVISKEVRQGTSQSGRSMMGYSFVVNFRTEAGDILELYAYEVEFGGLKEGMEGTLTYQGRYFVDFQ